MPYTSGKYSNVESEVYNYLKANGYNDAVAIGILANIDVETGSTFNPASYNSAEDAYGLCQWRGSRKSGLNYSYGSEPNTRSQVSYILDELATTETKAAMSLSNIPNTQDGAQLAALNFAKYYERCNPAYYDIRVSKSLRYWDYYTGSSADIPEPSGDLTLPRGKSELDINPIATRSLLAPSQLYIIESLSRMTPGGYDAGYLIDMQTNETFRFYIPEFSESAGVNWESIHIPGRSVDILSYDSTNSRQITINLDLYAGVGIYAPVDDGDDVVGRMHSDIYLLKSLEYPDYHNGLVDPPHTVVLKLGSALESLVGVVTDVKVEHLKPLDSQNRSMYAKVSFTVKQVSSDPPSCSDIRSGQTSGLSNTGRGGGYETPNIIWTGSHYERADQSSQTTVGDVTQSEEGDYRGFKLNSQPSQPQRYDDRGFPLNN